MSEWTATSSVAKAVVTAGFTYDPAQDIIVSRCNAWQRTFGFAYLYDVVAPLTISATIDCEPLFFSFDGKEWMIELWKGQYGLETGGEIGVYYRTTAHPLLDATIGTRPHDSAHGFYYSSASDADMLKMSFVLSRNGTQLFARGPERHWWLTGFRWGVLSRPEDLVMDITIDFERKLEMRRAFVACLEHAGYQNTSVDPSTAHFTFGTPRTFQPRNAPEWASVVAQVTANNEKLVKGYNSGRHGSNDPNGMTSAALVEYFTSINASQLAAALGTLLRKQGASASQVGDMLAKQFKVKADEAAETLQALGYKMQEIASVFPAAAKSLSDSATKAASAAAGTVTDYAARVKKAWGW